MKHHQKILAAALAFSGLLLFSCSKNSTNDLHDVQLCLNKADAGSAMGCVDKIAGDSSPIAYSLRCTAIFITQGFGSAASFVDALDSIGSGSTGCGGSCSSTVSAINALKFSAAGISNSTEWNANIDAANDAFSQCSQADAKIYTQIASLFKLGTLTAMLSYQIGQTAPGGTVTEADLKAALASGSLDAATVGSVVEITYDNTCKNTENASDSTKDYCNQLKTALDGGTTTAQIGQCLIEKLKDPSYSVPPCI
jgi:hypothetical protein